MKTMKMALGLMAVLIVSSVQGAVLFSEDCESYPGNPYNVANPGTNNWYNLGETSKQDGGIIGTYGTSAGYQGDSQNLFFKDNDSDVSGGFLVYNDSSSISNTGIVTVQFDFNVRDTINQNPSFELMSGSTRALQLEFVTPQGDLQYRIGGTAYDVISGGMVTDTWYRVEMQLSDLSETGDTFDLTLWEWTDNETLTVVTNATGLGFKTEVDYVDKFRFGMIGASYTSGAKYNVDNILIQDVDTSIDPYAVEMTLTGTTAVFGWEGVDFKTYALQTCTDLEAGAWSNLVEEISGVDGWMQTSNAVSGDVRFYRISAEDL